MDLVTLGELLVDMFPVEVGRSIGEVESFSPKPGGAPANVAVAASRLGAQTAFIGKVGDDHFGHFLAGVLEKEAVSTRGIRYDPEARTTMAVIAMPDEHTAEFVFYRNPGADQQLRPDELDTSLLAETRALHFGSLSLTDEPARSATLAAVDRVRQHNALVSYDVNYRPSLWKNPEEALEMALDVLPQTDLVKVNEVEAGLLTHGDPVGPEDLDRVVSAAEGLLTLGPDLVLVTLGVRGSYFQISDGGAFVPPFNVQSIDSVGCGDAFTAGLLVQLLSKADWRANLTLDRLLDVVRYANAVGALTSLTRGVIPALPTAQQVGDFLRTHDG